MQPQLSNETGEAKFSGDVFTLLDDIQYKRLFKSVHLNVFRDGGAIKGLLDVLRDLLRSKNLLRELRVQYYT